MRDVVKDFQIVCNFTGPLGDLTAIGDQPSGEVVLGKGAGHTKETTSTESEQAE